MDFLGVGVPELAVIIVLALIFVGPRDLPRLAGKAAKALRDLRSMTEGISAEWQREVKAADIDLSSVKELTDELTAAQNAVKKVTTSTLGLDELINPKPPAASAAADGTPPAAPKPAPDEAASPPTSSPAEESTSSDTANE